MPNPLRIASLLLALFGSFSQLSAEDRICRYCEHQWTLELEPLGVDLEGTYHYAPDRLFDVRHIRLDVTPDFAKRTVSGTVSITAAPIARPAELLRLDAIDLDIRQVRCDEARVVDFVSTRKDLQIVFADPIPPGTPVTVHIDYSAEPAAGLYFRTPEMGYPAADTHIWTQGEAHEARHWFPCFDYPNERSTSEVICHVPQDMLVLSNGRRVSERVDEGNLKAVRWLQDQPQPTYLICLVAGYFKKLEKKHRDVPLGFYTQPTLYEHAANSFRDTAEIMAFYESEIGVAFPWPKYDQVTIRDFTAGGMENTSLTTLTHNTIFSAATENIRSTRKLDAHEMAHQWFGDYVTCKDWSHLWLNEGFATYYAHLYEGHKFGRDALLYGLYRDASGRVLTQKTDKRPVVYKSYKNAMEQFDYRSYPKGSWILHMLRCQLGEELYRKCVRDYLERHALGSVVSEDLRQVLEQHSGHPMDRFFDQWVYRPRHPELNVSYQWMAKERLAKVTVRQTHAVDANVTWFQFPTRLRFYVDGKPIDHVIEVKDAQEDFYVALEKQPTIVRFDPDYTVLADVSFDKSNGLLEAQLENRDDMIGRLLACKAFGTRKTHAAAVLLAKALNEDPFYGVRITAAESLAKHDSDEAFQELERSWKSQTDARVRLAVVERVCGRFTADTPGWISRILNEERNPAIQAVAIKALGRFHGPETRDLLAKYLVAESFGNELAVAAISAIRQLNDPFYRNVLMDVLRQHESRFSTRGFGQGLEAFGHVASLHEEKVAARDFLAGYLGHPKSTVRTYAMNGLGLLGDASAIPILEAFTGARDQRVSRAAQQAIGKLRESQPAAPKEVIELRKGLQDLRQESEKLREELKQIRQQLQAQE